MRTSAIGLVGLTGLLVAMQARGAPADPAARGLDLFVHAPEHALSGSVLRVDVEAYGFAQVTSPSPLPGAEIRAAWDPETLALEGGGPPPEITVRADASGDASLDVPVPAGAARALSLILQVRHAEHVRTRTLKVQRVAEERVALRIPDTRVVPGSELPVWAALTSEATGRAIAGAEIEIALADGAGRPKKERFDRHVMRLRTNASGIVTHRVPIPASAHEGTSLLLEARRPGLHGASAERALTLREEVPGKPVLEATWDRRGVRAGETASWTVKVRDAAGEPLTSQAVRVWTGIKGTEAPKEKTKWDEAARLLYTDGEGILRGTAGAPSVVTSLGTTMALVARAELEGTEVEQRSTVDVSRPTARVDVDVEGRSLVPGVKQRVYLTVKGDDDKGVAGDFLLDGDGLAARVTTDAHGMAEATWSVPVGVGSTRQVGPCAGGVAATVRVRAAAAIAQLSRHTEPFDVCLPVSREKKAILRPSVYLTRIGDPARFEVALASADGGDARASERASFVLSRSVGFSTGGWLSRAGAELRMESAPPGVYELSAASPDARIGTVGARILLAPKVLPKLTASLEGGRAAPGGVVRVRARLSDGEGHPLVGSVAGMVWDRHGGGGTSGLDALDTRLSLCREAGVEDERCDELLAGKATLLERARIGTGEVAGTGPAFDPRANARRELMKTFSDVLHSLEGAVFEATRGADTLRDVRRRENGRWVMNPELMTLVTAAMSHPPETPGGEPLVLADLVRVDPQVTFDNVARRVTRLKLFSVLAGIRRHKASAQIDADEPALRDPNALLRRLVRSGTFTQDQLLDPWGGTLEFVPRPGPGTPFITAVRGWELRSPGPDGRLGTGDDVSDPFVRVVASRTPYAEAMGEDELVDAKLDMQVGDATVSSWESLFARLTGTQLGDATGAGGLGLGSGTGGGGGYGAGHGRIGTSRPTDGGTWLPPVRTDASGEAVIEVPLGDAETTYTASLVAIPDAGLPATAHADVPVSLPMSVKVDLGHGLTEGDRAEARVTVRNRTAGPLQVELAAAATGGLALDTAAGEKRSVAVPPRSSYTVGVATRAVAAGDGALEIRARARGAPEDVLVHRTTVSPRGEPRVLAQGLWVRGRADFDVRLPGGTTPSGDARIVIERGPDASLIAALSSLDADRLSSPDALADAAEVSASAARFATARRMGWLAERAQRNLGIAIGRLRELAPDPAKHPRDWAVRMRAITRSETAPRSAAPRSGAPAPAEQMGCPPPDLSDDDVITFLEAEPAPHGGPLPCFTSLSDRAPTGGPPVALARFAMAIADHPHHAPLFGVVARALATSSGVRPSGLPATLPRKDEAVVYAALLRSRDAWGTAARDVTAEDLERSLLLLRDAEGTFGSSEATRLAVRVLAARHMADGPTTPVRVLATGAANEVANAVVHDSAVLTLGPRTTRATVSADAPVIARFERPILRAYDRPEAPLSPVSISTAWDKAPKAGDRGVLHVTLATRGDPGRRGEKGEPVRARVHLPPGVSLAAETDRVKQRSGELVIRTDVAGETTLSIPVRYRLRGTFVVRPPEVVSLAGDAPRGIGMLQTLEVARREN